MELFSLILIGVVVYAFVRKRKYKVIVVDRTTDIWQGVNYSFDVVPRLGEYIEYGTETGYTYQVTDVLWVKSGKIIVGVRHV